LRNSTKGFSLTELLIAVAIILIIAAIVIPNLFRSRITGTVFSAVGCLRTLNTAEATYSSTYGVGYSLTLGYLAPGPAGNSPTSTAAGLIDSVLAGGIKSGYSFTYSPGTPDSTGRIKVYQITAVPITNSTDTYYWGTNYYYTDQSGVIRQNSTTTATSTDSPIAGWASGASQEVDEGESNDSLNPRLSRCGGHGSRGVKGQKGHRIGVVREGSNPPPLAVDLQSAALFWCRPRGGKGVAPSYFSSRKITQRYVSIHFRGGESAAE